MPVSKPGFNRGRCTAAEEGGRHDRSVIEHRGTKFFSQERPCPVGEMFLAIGGMLRMSHTLQLPDCRIVHVPRTTRAQALPLRPSSQFNNPFYLLPPTILVRHIVAVAHLRQCVIPSPSSKPPRSRLSPPLHILLPFSVKRWMPVTE